MKGAMRMLWRKERQIKQAVEDYLSEAEGCLASFGQAMDVYFAEALSERFHDLEQQTAQAESQTDSKRREIEAAMYGEALIPESRGDILGMLESIDLVPNKAESVLYQIWLQNMIVPQQYVDDMKRLIQANRESFTLLCDAARRIFADISDVMPIVDEVSAKEGESDGVERVLIKSMFDSPGDKADKILLKELVIEIGAISDRAENAADRLRILSIKRQT